jgi:hypothetical protein
MTKYDNIPGFPGYYISKRGGLWSNRKNGQWKKLKPHLNKMWNRYGFLKTKSSYLVNKSQIQLEIP